MSSTPTHGASPSGAGPLSSASAAVAALGWIDINRYFAFERWLETLGAFGIDRDSASVASADASFRRYFRFDSLAGTRIVMDAPPEHENCEPFVRVAALLRGASLNAPEVLDWNVQDGFMLLADLGTRTYLSQLDEHNAPRLYGDALAALVRMQGIGEGVARPPGNASAVPPYDEALLRREMALFPEWYIARHLGVALDEDEQEKLAQCTDLIVRQVLSQPTALVHRDYHSRNLMVCEEPAQLAPQAVPANPGILDFQDAVWGPLSYDVASLLRDAYVELPEEMQIDFAVRYWERARRAGLPVPSDFGDFWRDFEWMGLQRHLKVLGIFARLSHRDGKHGYLGDLPLVWRYAHRVCTRYQGLGPLAQLLEKLAGVRREEGYTF